MSLDYEHKLEYLEEPFPLLLFFNLFLFLACLLI